jgi:hypothetical protein
MTTDDTRPPTDAERAAFKRSELHRAHMCGECADLIREHERARYAALVAALEVIENETTLPPRPTHYRRGWAVAHANAARIIRAALDGEPR